MIQILDCTLRDGGYINDWRFGRSVIRGTLQRLEEAHIDIIECGFLTGMVHDDACSLFHSPEAIEPLLPAGERRAMYVAMIAMGEKELHPSALPVCSGKGITGIRLTFHQSEIDQAIAWARLIQEKGYLVFMQPVGTVLYTDLQLLQLVERMNELSPYAFYIVDTLGSMYRSDVAYRFYLIDENLSEEIHIGFHAHNNLQLAFANAQALGQIQTRRTLLLDSSVYGMGRGAGNLPTELITQYINKTAGARYDVTRVMDIYDEYIAPIRHAMSWGYSMPYHIAASHICHPNYATYLLGKRTLTMKDIERIILSIPAESKITYDPQLIRQLYHQFQSRHIDDAPSVATLSAAIAGRSLLLLAPGPSLQRCEEHIQNYIQREKPYVISVNCMPPQFHTDACFVSNHKRLDMIGRELARHPEIQALITSNIPRVEAPPACWYVDYDRYTNADPLVSDNAGLMLLSLLRACGAKAACLAGFDGFAGSAQQDLHARFRRQLELLALSLTFLTPSPYAPENGGCHV